MRYLTSTRNDLWWQSGNIIETIARFGIQDAAFKEYALMIISNTYAKSPQQHGADGWKNKFYDDEGWWAMGWIASYDLTGDVKYLNTAKDIFEDMTGGWNTPCGGGIWWSKDRDYIAAISNELFLSVASHLANRAEGQEKEDYTNWATMEWDWFKKSGVINSDGLVNDGLDPSSCKNNGRTTFTYNQGIVLAGLSELARAKNNGDYIKEAYTLATASTTKLSDGSGILTEPVGGALDPVSSQFKGAYVRGLSTLYENAPQEGVQQFFMRNANAARSQPRVDGGVIIDLWQGPSENGNPSTHASGIDILVAAALAGEA
jgi:predicted alpha-1,6-mannanase (GH76 family)